MAHISWIYNKINENTKRKLEREFFYYIITFSNIIGRKRQFSFYKFINDGYILRSFDKNQYYYESIELDGEKRINFLYQGDSSGILNNDNNFKIFAERFNKGFLGKSFYCLGDEKELFYITENQIIDFVKSIEKENQEYIYAYGSTQAREFIDKKLLELYPHLKNDNSHTLFDKNEKEFIEKNTFLRKNIFKIINSFVNNTKDKKDLYEKIIR